MIAAGPSGTCGNLLCGNTGTPLRGLPHGKHLEAISGSGGSAALVWRELEEGMDLAQLGRQVYLNGALLSEVAGVTRTIVSPLRASGQVEIDLLALTRSELGDVDETQAFVAKTVGSRVLLSWGPPPTDADFWATRIYWDVGTGGAVTTLLETVEGQETTAWTSPQLPDGVYQFAISWIDFLGNESAIGTPVEITVDTIPQTLESAALSYSDETRVASFSWAQPSGQDADVVGVLVCHNHLALAPLDEAWGDHPNLEPELLVAFIPLGTETWDSPPLFTAGPGLTSTWIFALRAVDKWGNESDFTELTLRLAESGGTVSEVAPPPAQPLDLLAESRSGARVRLTWTHAGASTTGFRIYRDGVEFTTVAPVAGDQQSWTSSAMTDATTYIFTVAAYNDGGEGPLSAEASVTTDGTAPSADQTVTAELVD